MTQVLERAVRAARTRRLSAEEFCALVRREAGSFYRPHTEVLRMLAVGEAWGVCAARDAPQAGLLTLPLEADAAAAAALRSLLDRRTWMRRGFLLTPPVGTPEPQAGLLLDTALAAARRRAPNGPVWAALECTPEAEALLGAYLRRGLALRVMRPLEGLAPYYLFCADGPAVPAAPVWVPLADTAQLALLLSRGWAAVDSRASAGGLLLALCPA